ncbi:MAG: glycosyltransferase involved in cell wall biosynthesis [Pseudoalteromonas tetraodonis]|jgi:glycosyltransferase involved in cell wall biosynthesis
MSISQKERFKESPAAEAAGTRARSDNRPLVSIVVAAYNEEILLEVNLAKLCDYMAGLEHDYRWEILLVNDGSKDATAEIANRAAAVIPEVTAIHHPINMGLCEALKTGFRNCKGKYCVTLDIDLSYTPDHIERLLNKLRETQSHVVIASPYMEGGSVKNVPWLRRVLSKYSNKFLNKVSPENIHTFTGMVRAYDVEFLQRLNLKSKGMDVNPEIIYKAILLRARIAEIPAQLEWDTTDEEEDDKEAANSRKSSLNVPWQTLAILFSGFVFRPFLFFFIPGFLLFITSIGLGIAVIIHCFLHALEANTAGALEVIWATIQSSYADHGGVFFLSGGLLIVSIQLLSLGFLSMQNKRYFEEIFHLGTTIHRHQDQTSNT